MFFGMFFPWNFIASRDRMGNSTGSSQGFCGVFLPLLMLENVADGGFKVIRYDMMQFLMHCNMMQHDEMWCNMMRLDAAWCTMMISWQWNASRQGWTFWFGSLLVKNGGPQVSWNKSLRNYDHFCIQPPVANLYEFCAKNRFFFWVPWTPFSHGFRG